MMKWYHRASRVQRFFSTAQLEYEDLISAPMEYMRSLQGFLQPGSTTRIDSFCLALQGGRHTNVTFRADGLPVPEYVADQTYTPTTIAEVATAVLDYLNATRDFERDAVGRCYY